MDLATGNTSAHPAIDLPEAAYLHQLLPLGGDRIYVGLMAAEADSLVEFSVVVINNGNVRQIYMEGSGEGNPEHLPFSKRSISRGREATPRCRHDPDSSGFATRPSSWTSQRDGLTRTWPVLTSTGATETQTS
jgi:hypothetical protein